MKSKKKLIIAGVAVVAIIGLIFGLRTRGTGDTETVTVMRGELVKTVNVSGKVVAVDSADLAFARAGTVAAVYKKIGDKVRAGDLLAALSAGSARADLSKAQADLAAAQAEASKVGTGSQSSRAQSAQRDASQAIAEAFSAADDAVHTKVDQFFDDPRTANPRIVFAFNDYQLKEKINAERVDIEGVLLNFSLTDIASARAQLSQIASFLTDVASAVSRFEPTSDLSQSTIDKYRTDVASARTSVNGALSGLVSAQNSLSDVASDEPVESAKVAAAQASVARYQAELSDSLIVAPFNGVVTRMDAKVGEAVSANSSLVGVKSEGYRIEAFVPEVSIAGLAVGNPAQATLDAYGSGVVFDALVSHVDPAETEKDGVSNYRIELSFNTPDGRVRSGMTANVTVETMRKADALLVPLRSVKDEKVLVVSEGETVERAVETGVTDSKGNVEIVSGLSEGDTILIDPVAK
ncbi:MAG TPA: efflux RND transporter periplasmic adaptor subunit [Candidatus Paceibacterota bacterium]|jgi:Multidrug resistance efflux pump